MKSIQTFIYSIIIAAICLWPTFSCETVVDIEIPFEKPQVILNSKLQYNYFPVVRLTYSKHALDNNYQYDPISNAQVRLMVDDSSYELAFREDTGDYINLEHLIEAGKAYRIEVLVDDYQPVSASDQTPLVTPIKRFTYNGKVQRDSWSTSDDITLVFDDPAGENYYEISGYTIRKYTYPDQHGNMIEHIENRPVYLSAKNPTYENDFNSYGSILMDDKLFDGKEASIDLFSNGNYFSDDVDSELYFVLKSVSKSYYLFQSTFGLQYWNEGDPFAQPVQVYSNINNGIGIFMSESADTLRIK